MTDSNINNVYSNTTPPLSPGNAPIKFEGDSGVEGQHIIETSPSPTPTQAAKKIQVRAQYADVIIAGVKYSFPVDDVSSTQTHVFFKVRKNNNDFDIPLPVLREKIEFLATYTREEERTVPVETSKNV